MHRTERKGGGLTRRTFLLGGLAGGALGLAGTALLDRRAKLESETFIARVGGYGAEIAGVIVSGLRELGIGAGEVSGRRVLLKPNLVEVLEGAEHINTHPLVVRGAVEAFLRLGASEVRVGEAQGHVRDSLLVLEQSGLETVLREDSIPFVDLNNDRVFVRPNAGKLTRLSTLALPEALRRADLVVSLAKMKTHHWAGVTLSMKNLFGVMPGVVYGWPKNVLHHEGIERSILDINATVRPHLAIVDGIVGMEGDGPIMGTPRHAGVLVMGRNPVAVDATCARVMGVDPHRVAYLEAASGWLGPAEEERIAQRGENVAAVRTDFRLCEEIPAHRGLRLA